VTLAFSHAVTVASGAPTLTPNDGATATYDAAASTAMVSSGVADCPAADMVMMVVCKSAWHRVCERLGTLSTYVGKAFSTGSVRLSTRDPEEPPQVRFDWLSDARDMARLVQSFRYMATILVTGGGPHTALDPFTVGFSNKVKKAGRQTYKNVVLTTLAGAIMDSSAILRRAFIRFFITGGLSLEFLLRDERALEDYIRRAVTGIWHPCGTCKMGHADYPMSVVDAGGQVIGLDNLFVADAAIMPEIPTTNLNMPTIMIAERMADIFKGEIKLADAF
jgi:5-(hydroxymethyl)furfural/furfural oxidase